MKSVSSMDENLEIWRDVLRQVAVHGESETLRTAAAVALRHHAIGPIGDVLQAAVGSRHMRRLQLAHTNLWLQA